MGLFSLVWGNMSDHYGRKVLIVASMCTHDQQVGDGEPDLVFCFAGMFVAFSIGLCFVTDINTLIIMRTFQPIGIAASLSVCISCCPPMTMSLIDKFHVPPPPRRSAVR
jgi:MFS family permease